MSGWSILLSQLLRILCELKCVDEFIDISIQYILEIVERHADPVIGNPTLGEIIGPDLGAAVAGADKALPMPGDLILLLPDLLFV